MSFGRLQTPRGDTGESAPFAEINVTPLVDVMLVLVVIFILAAPLMLGAVHVELPRTQGATTDGALAAQVALTLDANGRASMADVIVDDGELARRLKRQALADPQTEILLRADRRVPHGRVIEIMDLAQNAGLSRIGFVTEGKPSSTP